MTMLYRANPDVVETNPTVGFALQDHVIYRPVYNEVGALNNHVNRAPGSELSLALNGNVHVLALVGEAEAQAALNINIEFIGINEPGERGDLARRMIAAGYPMVGGEGVQVIRLHCAIPFAHPLQGDYSQCGNSAICALTGEDDAALLPHFDQLHEECDYWG